MTNLTLISTIYTLEPVIVCVTRLSPSKLILLTEEGTVEKKLRSEQTIEDTFGKIIDIQKKNTSLYDPVQVAQDVANLIEEEHAQGNHVMINVSGGRKPQAFGALFGAYTRSDMVKRIVYVTEEDNFIIDFPILSFAYNHLRELKAMGYITGEDGYSITDAGKIAVI
jgi:CRISPR-associated protein Csa3